MAKDKYNISVIYVDFPMGSSPEYGVSGGWTKEEAEVEVEKLLCEVDKDPQKYACCNPHYYIRNARTGKAV